MDFLAQLNYVEVFGFVTGVTCVWLYTRQNVWSWPIGLVNSVVFVVVFFQARLYADTGLYLIYALLSIYGWYEWLHGGPQHGELKISRLTRTAALVLLGLAVVGVAGLSYGLRTYTDAALPFWDSLTTAMSLAAQWMLAKKIFETWIVWITVDVIYLGVYFYRDLYLTAGLHLIYLALAIVGLLAWRTSMRAESATVSA